MKIKYDVPAGGNWRSGCIELSSNNGPISNAKYEIKVFSDPSIYGIENGRISKLYITIDDTQTACYDRGWDVKPPETDKTTWTIINMLLDKYKVKEAT